MRPRFSGVLLHISSLPSNFGIGDLGPAAYGFAETLASKGISHWQFLPLSPTSTFIGNSPYSSPSAFAGNPLFISPELLLKSGLISHGDLDSALSCTPAHSLGDDESRVDYNAVSAQRQSLLQIAFERAAPNLPGDQEYLAFCRTEAFWLEDYALFMSLKDGYNGASWVDWPKELRDREAVALTEWKRARASDIERHKFTQLLFFRQWQELHSFCRQRAISLVGDLPIYVTHDSADVWTHAGLFNLDEHGNPVTVAGVPPDYFSSTGQRWGNPVYRWDAMRADGFAWWKKRLGHNLRLVETVRLDHFRGFCGYWEIPAAEATAINGAWREAPGQDFFTALARLWPQLPIIAEDLGVITPDVRELMHNFKLSGMKVLQFAFGGNPADSPHIPFRHNENHVVYTGTHDNATTREWFATAPAWEKANFSAYAGCPVSNDTASSALARLALSSPAALAVLPMQDILGLDATGRMNTPSVAGGNWSWRMRKAEAEPKNFDWMQELCRLYGRT